MVVFEYLGIVNVVDRSVVVNVLIGVFVLTVGLCRELVNVARKTMAMLFHKKIVNNATYPVIIEVVLVNAIL